MADWSVFAPPSARKAIRSAKPPSASGQFIICSVKQIVPVLLVPEGLDGIEIGSAEGGKHTTANANQSQNRSGNQQDPGSDNQANIPCLAMFGQSAVESQGSDRKRNQIGKQNAANSTNRGNH